MISNMSFNSSQVGWKPYHSSLFIISLHCFNSSQVGWKRWWSWGANISLQVSIPQKFQFLIGRLETGEPGAAWSGLIVSIPHRQAGNAPLPFFLQRAGAVSIPHRQAGNSIFQRPTLKMALFQFLIGRLETFFPLPDLVKQIGFQFLIGRLETTEGLYFIGAGDQFQFLIGRLETTVEFGLQLPGACFNSSQVGWKREVYEIEPCGVLGFNSSQVGWKPL